MTVARWRWSERTTGLADLSSVRRSHFPAASKSGVRPYITLYGKCIQTAQERQMSGFQNKAKNDLETEFYINRPFCLISRWD